jgi:hypothetical protein
LCFADDPLDIVRSRATIAVNDQPGDACSDDLQQRHYREAGGAPRQPDKQAPSRTARWLGSLAADEVDLVTLRVISRPPEQ